MQHYDKGGLNTKTGLAWLDGTPSKPEYILNAEQTAILREALLGSKPLSRSIASTSAELTGSENTMSSYYNSVNHNDVIEINGLSLNLNVPAVASDYDASKIGEIAMNEIVKIARKSGTRSLSRR